jgi:hypothetical protein
MAKLATKSVTITTDPHSDLEQRIEMLKLSLRRIPHWKRVLIAKLLEGALSK